MLKILTKYRELVIVFFISCLMVVLTTANLFTQMLSIPQNHVFMGMSHYFEDYYYYLDQFEQGREGNWLTVNHFTSEKYPPTLIYFDNLLMGKIGGLLGWESYV